MSTQPDANSVSLGELESLCKPRVEPECLRNNEGPGYGEKTNFIWGDYHQKRIFTPSKNTRNSSPQHFVVTVKPH